MKNRTLAIIGFVIFTTIVWYELDALESRLDHLGMTPMVTCTARAVPTEASDMQYELYSEARSLNTMNSILGYQAIADHPGLKPKIDYALFKTTSRFAKRTTFWASRCASSRSSSTSLTISTRSRRAS